MRVCIITNDKYLKRSIALALDGAAEICDADECDMYIYDCDFGLPVPQDDKRIITVSRLDVSYALRIPMPIDAWKKLIADNSTASLSLVPGEKAAALCGKRIKLTSHEYALLSLLIDGGGNYTERKTISDKVFGGAGDGLINIYIHYLREKLEKDGEKIIISSRKQGYKINEKYLGGKND